MHPSGLTLGKWATGVVAGGLILGALLGAAADPDMKGAPEPWWQQTGREEAIAEAEPVLFEDPRNFHARGGFRPDLDYDAEVWALPIPDYETAALADESYDPYDPFADELPEAPYDTNAERAADRAEQAADDAVEAREAENPPAATEVRKSELAVAGLY